MSVVNFSKDSFEKAVESGKLVLVDFWASWCGPCKMQAPVFEAVSEENSDVIFGKVNVDDEDELAVKYSVMNIPTIMLFKNGEFAAKLVGFHGEDDLQEIIDENK